MPNQSAGHQRVKQNASDQQSIECEDALAVPLERESTGGGKDPALDAVRIFFTPVTQAGEPDHAFAGEQQNGFNRRENCYAKNVLHALPS